MKIILKVENMICEGCEKRIENAFDNKVKADHKKGEVEIINIDQLNIEDVKEKLEDLGFNVE